MVRKYENRLEMINDSLSQEIDKLTRENDRLRETLNLIVESVDVSQFPDEVNDAIDAALARLEETEDGN